MENKSKTKFLLGLAITSALSLIIVQTYMIFQSTYKVNPDSGEGINGSVGLRKYFDSGTGTSSDPYNITRPMHLYNLSRLQALGAFLSKKYYSLGKDMGSGTILVYTGDTGTATTTTLNMTGRSILSIGSTGYPFFGEFEGNGLTISNLTIDANPEDIGFFGYTASESKVSNLTLDNIIVNDKGYYNQVQDMFTADLDTNSGLTYASTALTTTASAFSSLSDLFVPSYPSSSLLSNVTYEARSSNQKIFINTDNISGLGCLSLDTTTLSGNTNYTSVNNAVIKTRIYLLANRILDNVKYSKILSSYTVSFINSTSSGSSVITMEAYKDPSINSTEAYHHNTNIGFIAGHCDGSISSCNVHNGYFKLNEADSTRVPWASETDYGLVGEKGINVNGVQTPQESLNDSGDTGVINFTDIYSNILGSNAIQTNQITETYNGTTYNYYYYDTDSGSLYNDYLRKRLYNAETGATMYLTNATNSIDFKGRKLITDEKDSSGKITIDRGLGIFQLNTADYDNDSIYTGGDATGAGYLTGLGSFDIRKDTSFDSVYYTTAEFNANNMTTSFPASYDGTNNITAWSPTSTKSNYRINAGTTIPNVSNTSAFDDSVISTLVSSPRFERNFNYIFKLSLFSNTANYFSGTSNLFIRDYFKYKLRDKFGLPLDPSSNDFGVMLKNVENGISTNALSFDSYLGMSANNGTIGQMTSDGITYPSKTIQFEVKADKGANVTIVARSASSCGNYVCIYDKNYISNSNEGYYPSYAMYLPNTYNDTTEGGMPYYFTYNNATGNLLLDNNSKIIAPQVDSMTDKLYAHTFFLPKGTYYLGSPVGSAQIYYIAAQGQEGQGNSGDRTIIYISENVISDINFLIYDPSQLKLVDAYITFGANFTTSTGQLDVIDSNSSSVQDGHLYFNCPAPLSKMVIYKSLSSAPSYYFNGVAISDTYFTYTA